MITADMVKEAVEANKIPLISGSGWLDFKDSKICGACALSHLMIQKVGLEETHKLYVTHDIYAEAARILGLTYTYVYDFTRGFDKGNGSSASGYLDGELVRKELRGYLNEDN